MRVKVEVSNKGAIFVDDTRITNRSTKWSCAQNIIDWWECEKDEVRITLIENGYGSLLPLIDNQDYIG